MKTAAPGRRCACGTKLSIYNLEAECGSCEVASKTWNKELYPDGCEDCPEGERFSKKHMGRGLCTTHYFQRRRAEQDPVEVEEDPAETIVYDPPTEPEPDDYLEPATEPEPEERHVWQSEPVERLEPEPEPEPEPAAEEPDEDQHPEGDPDYDAELEAMGVVYHAMRHLTRDAQQRILTYTIARLGRG